MTDLNKYYNEKFLEDIHLSFEELSHKQKEELRASILFSMWKVVEASNAVARAAKEWTDKYLKK